MHPTVREIDAAATRPLRQRILRPHQQIEDLVYAGDAAADTLHVGVFVDAQLVCIASAFHQPPPGEQRADAWQLRGVATDQTQQRRGYARLLLEWLEQALAERFGCRLIWCNARVAALPLYTALGYTIVSEPFDVPEIGPHVVMRRDVRASV